MVTLDVEPVSEDESDAMDLNLFDEHFEDGVENPALLQLMHEEEAAEQIFKESPSPSSPADNQHMSINSEKDVAPEGTNCEKNVSVDTLATSSLGQVSSLADTRIPTDFSDTTESENERKRGETRCFCEGHCGKQSLDMFYRTSVDHLFNMLFSDSPFYTNFQEERKTTDLIQSEWQENRETGNKTRQISYTLNLGLAFGPKTAQTTETQTLLKGSKTGSLYVIDIDVVNSGIPYCDTFYTNHRYCLTHVSANECRIRVHSQIKYRKSAWMVKTFIEKNVMQGIEDFMKELQSALQRDYVRQNQQKPPKTRRRRRLHKPDSSKSESAADAGGNVHTAAPNRGTLEFARLVNNPECLVKIILFVLMILLVVNVLLYYKLWLLENQTSRILLPPSLLDTDFLRNPPRTADEWAQLVQQQEKLHQIELEKWAEILQSSIKLLQQTEDSLVKLHKGIRPYQIQRILQLVNGDHNEDENTKKGDKEEL